MSLQLWIAILVTLCSVEPGDKQPLIDSVIRASSVGFDSSVGTMQLTRNVTPNYIENLTI